MKPKSHRVAGNNDELERFNRPSTIDPFTVTSARGRSWTRRRSCFKPPGTATEDRRPRRTRVLDIVLIYHVSGMGMGMGMESSRRRYGRIWNRRARTAPGARSAPRWLVRLLASETLFMLGAVVEDINIATVYIHQGIATVFPIGSGSGDGPLNHMHLLLSRTLQRKGPCSASARLLTENPGQRRATRIHLCAHSRGHREAIRPT